MHVPVADDRVVDQKPAQERIRPLDFDVVDAVR